MAEVRNYGGVATSAVMDAATANVRTGYRYDLNGNETDRYAWGAGPVAPIPLTLYLTSNNDSLLPTARQLSTTAPVSEIGSDTSIGTAMGWGELFSQGTAGPWAAAASAPPPSGQGFLWNASTLEAQQLAAGNWAPTLKLRLSTPAPATVTADLHVRIFLRMSTGSYLSMVDVAMLGQTVDSTSRTFPLPPTGGPAVNFGVGDKLYVDVLLSITANTTADPLARLSLFMNSAAASEQVVTPGYGPTPWVTTHGDYDLNGNRIRQVLNQVSGAPETGSQNVTTTYTFDALNRMVDEQRPAASAGGSTIRRRVYDTAGRLVQLLCCPGQIGSGSGAARYQPQA
jgi:hypothetical protein